MKKSLPKHLKNLIDKNMEIDAGRMKLARLIGASHYRKKSGKIAAMKR